jgi:protoporphyrinogen/coproporphyrinogen III oxidase
MIKSLFLSLILAGPAGAKTPEQKIADHMAQFKGESCKRCHDLVRDGKDAKTEAPEPRRQVVIVGGGLAGLSAAHFLRDLDVLVLEKEEKAGGHARRESFENGPYPVAAVYLDKPEGVVKEMMDDLKLSASPIVPPAETLRFRDKAIAEFLSDGVGEFPPDVRPEIEHLSRELKAISEKNIVIPVLDSDKELIARFEGISFYDYLKPFGALSVSIGDMFVKDMFGAGARDVSALMGLLYIMDMITPSGLSWPGGLGVASEALAKELGPKVRTGAFVVSVRQTPEGARVEYMQEGKRKMVEADAVIFATHMLVTQRVAKDLSEEKKKAMAKIKYSSYVTVPLSFNEMVWDKGYSLWSADSFFTDITWAGKNNSRFPGTEKLPGQVGVAYCPLGDSSHAARRALMKASDAEIIGKVKKDLEKVLPGSLAKLKDARVIRWGHAMPVMGPNYFRDIQPVIARPEKRYFFAGEDTQAPALEGAVYSGYYAARDARKLLSPR